MVLARSFRRWGGIAAAMLVLPGLLVLPLSCATGGSDSFEEGGGFGESSPPGHDSGHAADSQSDGFNYPENFKIDTGAKDTSPPLDSTLMDSGTDTKPPPKDTGVKDTSLPDTSSCVAVTVTAGTPTTTCPAPVTGTCGMGDVSAFSPSWVPPSGYHLGLCTTTQITSIYTDCFGPLATSTKCTKIMSTASACYGCLVTMEGSSSYGPLISTSGGIVSVNQGGCIDLLEPCNKPCAEAALGAFQCENAACETNCPVTSGTPYPDGGSEFHSYEGCVDTSINCDPDGCSSYYTEATNCGMLLTGTSHPASICVATTTSTFKGLYDAIAPVFCGP